MMNIAKIETNNLPSLTGASEKQVQYGEDMRMRMIATYNNFVSAYDEIDETGLSEVEFQNAQTVKKSLKSGIDDDAMFAVEGETLGSRIFEEWLKEKETYKVKGEPIPKGTKEQFKEKMRVDALASKKAEIEQMIEEHKDAKWWIEHR